MKTFEFVFRGKTYHMIYNGAAMFELQDAVKDQKDRDIYGDLSKDFEYLCTAVEILTRHGELVRRYEGYDEGEMLDAEKFKHLASAIEVMTVRGLAMQAILSGMSREVEDEDEEDTDISLIKAQKKTGRSSKKQTTS